MSVHNEYTGCLLKHLLLRHIYNLPLPVLMCHAQALCSETSTATARLAQLALLLNWLNCSTALTLYCAVLYILLV